jgi:hypothetical protein
MAALASSLLLGSLLASAQADTPEARLSSELATSPVTETSPPAGDLLLQAATGAPEAATGEIRQKRPLMELNFRSRYLSIPNSILDLWYFDADDEGVNYPYERPKVRLYSVGVEYVLKPRPNNWIFYYDYTSSLMGEGYWDDVEEPGEHDDGSWLAPSNFGMHSIGANYAGEIVLSPQEKNVWLSMLLSAGLGVGFVTGELTEWNPGSNPDNTDPTCLPDAPAYERKDSCPADGSVRFPGVLPILDLTVSTRVNFADRANARIDIGLHNMFYVGGAVGGVF